MNLSEAYIKLQNSNHPVAINLLKNSNNKVFVMFFKTGMTLHDHKTIHPAVLYVLVGSVRFNFPDNTVLLEQYQEIIIPPGAMHNIECISEATCLLIQN